MMHFLHWLFHFAPSVTMAYLMVPQNPPSGYSTWGGGPGPTGLKNSPGVAAKPGFNKISVNQYYQVTIQTSGVPVRAPHIFVPPGTMVGIRAHNGLAAGNVAVIYVSDQPEMLLGHTTGQPITPDSEISWPCDNLGEIWISGQAGDGVYIKIQAQRGH